MMLIEERDIQKYAAYLARRQSWALKYRQDMDLDDLESMAALGILEAIKEYGTETVALKVGEAQVLDRPQQGLGLGENRAQSQQ